jgi:hypothetical protein
VLLQRLWPFSIFSPQSSGFHTEAAPAEDSHATFRGTEEDEREDVVTVDAPCSHNALTRPSHEAV